ncbi:MAG: ornithine cyclodeaminase family protein [Caldilineae bacterium]|nr:MAG: ornithine cyclodeaminase family protein [Caldilineae bacterium]
MTHIFTREQIERILPSLHLLPAIEDGFARYSAGDAVVPPVGELLLPGGEVHIKYGYLRDDPYYVVKIASGFYGNPQIGLPSSNGLMLLFSQQTGTLEAALLDEGHLTDIRTAMAGAVAARHLAPPQISRIGIVGTGTQARLQLLYLSKISPCRQVLVWGRNAQHARTYRQEMEQHGFLVEIAQSPDELLHTCQLIVTTTPATCPLLYARDLRPGVHITAVGSDTPAKQELDPDILAHADLVVADSISQCLERGEIHHAVAYGVLSREHLLELGDIVAGRAPGRTSPRQISVADLTGVAVQDIKIAQAVYSALTSRSV